MRVGIVTTWFERGAAYVSRQYRRQLERQHELFVYARGNHADSAAPDPAWDDPNVTWGREGIVPATASINLEDFRAWIRSRGIEVVLFNEQHWWPPVLECLDLKIVTGSYVDYYTRQTAPLFDAFDFLVCNTRRHYSVFEHHPQAIYIPWGTDVGVFRPSSSAPKVPGTVTFFHSAGMNPPRKGTDLLLQAFANVTDAARLIVHTQVSLRCLESCQDLIEGLTGQGRLEVVEKTVAAPGLYHLGDVYVYPSRLDGIGLSVAEALACGLPVITTNEGPMNEFVTEETGRLVRVAERMPRGDDYYWPFAIPDVNDLAAQMRWYVEHRELIPELQRAARRHAEERLDWSRNSSGMGEQFAAFKPLRTPRQAAAVEEARTFEGQRARQSLRYWTSFHFPKGVEIARGLYRTLARTR